MSYGGGCRCVLDPVLVWLWNRLAAVVPIQPLAWELPYAMCVALKKKKKNQHTGLVWASNPIGCVLIKEEYLDTEIHTRRTHVNMKAEVG